MCNYVPPICQAVFQFILPLSYRKYSRYCECRHHCNHVFWHISLKSPQGSTECGSNQFRYCFTVPTWGDFFIGFNVPICLSEPKGQNSQPVYLGS